jgi:hypothetical protein
MITPWPDNFVTIPGQPNDELLDNEMTKTPTATLSGHPDDEATANEARTLTRR